MSRILHFSSEIKTFSADEMLFGVHTDGDTDTTEVLGVLKELGFRIAENPEDAKFIISYGGDGTLLGAARKFQNKRIIPVRRGGDIKRCDHHDLKTFLKRMNGFAHNCTGITSTYLPKINVVAVDGRGKQIDIGFALNDATVRQHDPTMALRYRLEFFPRENKPAPVYFRPFQRGYTTEEIVGDGIVVATPFGSSGYYRSITKSVVRQGMGLAFNNSTEAVDHQVLHEDSQFMILPTRGRPMLVLDNDTPYLFPEDYSLKFSLTSGADGVEVLGLDSLVCRDCYDTRINKPAGFRHV